MGGNSLLLRLKHAIEGDERLHMNSQIDLKDIHEKLRSVALSAMVIHGLATEDERGGYDSEEDSGRVRSGSSMAGLKLPEFPLSEIERVCELLVLFPHAPARYILDVMYPVATLPLFDRDMKYTVMSVYDRFGAQLPKQVAKDSADHEDVTKDGGYEEPFCPSAYRITNVSLLNNDIDSQMKQANITFAPVFSGSVSATVACFGGLIHDRMEEKNPFVHTRYHDEVLCQMAQLHSAGLDMCLMGDKGVGKSMLTRTFARMLGYRLISIPLYKDMTAKSLLMKRATTLSGDTIWQFSALTRAAVQGSIFILYLDN